MKYMLDTSICIYVIRNKPPTIAQKLTNYVITDFTISAISVAELQYGVSKSRQPARNQQALNQFLIPLTILDFDHAAAIAYGAIRTALESVGLPINSLDLLIAAHAYSRKLTLITNNAREFSRVSGLTVEEWSFS